MDFPVLHSWNLLPAEAIALQQELARQVVLENRLPAGLRRVAGVDVSYRLHGTTFYAAVAVLSYPELELVDSATAVGEVRFPYVPGLLSFRELPILLEAFRRLPAPPDLVLVDGQGVAHPRRFGLASHLGLWLDLPTVGCAKSRLTGSHAEPAPRRCAQAPLQDGDERIGTVLVTRDRVKPLYVSPGHLVDHPTAAELTLACTTRYRMPEPTRQAHLLSNRLRRGTNNQ